MRQDQYYSYLLVIILTLISSPGIADGLSGGTDFAMGLIYIALSFVVLWIVISIMWYIKIKKIWVFFYTPLILFDVIIIVVGLFPIIGSYVTDRYIDPMAIPFFSCLTIAALCLVYCIYWYKKSTDRKTRNIFILILIPFILIAFPTILLNITNLQ